MATGTRRVDGKGLHPIETASRDEIEALQLTRLQWSLRHAYDNVPYFRAAFDEKGVHPADVKSLADLSKIPYTTKDTYRQNYPFGLFAVPREEIVRVHASSGTTGKPTVVGYTKEDIVTWSDCVARSIYASGGRPGDIVHIAFGYGLFTGGMGVHYGAERLGCTVIPVSGGQTEKQVQLLRDFDPDIIMVTPSYMLVLLDEMERQGLTGGAARLRIGIFGAEPWSEEMRAEIEARAGIDAVDIYGLSEVIGPGVGNECVETKDGIHIWEDHFYPEIVDPETGAVLPDGEFGELVLTSLTKIGMPTIRYRTKDLTRLLPGSARAMRRIEKITGRSDDMLIIRGVNVFPSQIEELILAHGAFAPHYQIHLTKKGPLDEMTVSVELREAASAEPSEAEKALKHAIKSQVGISVAIKTMQPGEIARSEGKAKRVFDLRRS